MNLLLYRGWCVHPDQFGEFSSTVNEIAHQVWLSPSLLHLGCRRTSTRLRDMPSTLYVRVCATVALSARYVTCGQVASSSKVSRLIERFGGHSADAKPKALTPQASARRTLTSTRELSPERDGGKVDGDRASLFPKVRQQQRGCTAMGPRRRSRPGCSVVVAVLFDALTSPLYRVV